jgi:hypothetical protein
LSSAFTAILAAPAPTETPKPDGDVDSLQYALILEHLENAFYTKDTAKFGKGDSTGFPLDSKVVDGRFIEIASHEQTHVAALMKTITAIGGTPLPACTYEFGIKNVNMFVATARVLETVGASAYLGRLPEMTEKDDKTAAGSIALVEARHSSFLNTLNKISGFGNSFETPLSARSVVTLASPFIKSCPFEIPIKGFPALKLNQMTASVEDKVDFAKTTATFCAFSVGLASVWVPIKDSTSCIVPNVSGDVFVHLTSDNSTLLAKDASVVAGPTLLHVKMSTEAVKMMKQGDKYNHDW